MQCIGNVCGLVNCLWTVRKWFKFELNAEEDDYVYHRMEQRQPSIKIYAPCVTLHHQPPPEPNDSIYSAMSAKE